MKRASDIFAESKYDLASNDLFIDDLADVFFLLESDFSEEVPSFAREKIPANTFAPWRSDDFFSISVIVNR